MAAPPQEAEPKPYSSDGKSHVLSPDEITTLREKSIAAKERAYCPYSAFRVGCAVLTADGTYTIGANVENASYPVGTCAERVALGSAVVAGYRGRAFRAIAVATDFAPPESRDGAHFTTPCGMCRQFIAEFCQGNTPVLMFNKHGHGLTMSVDQLLPMSFGPAQLSGDMATTTTTTRTL